MTRKRASGLAAILLLLSAATVAGAQQWTAPKPTDKVDGGVNWTTHLITASAIGAAPPSAVSPEHGRALAITAGTLLARQELLSIARGVIIDSATTVQNLMVTSAVTEGRISGVIRGARVVDTKDLGGGTVEVTVAIPATGEFANMVLPSFPAPRPPAPVAVSAPPPAPSPAPSPAPAPAAARPTPLPPIFTGLVIDARGLGIKPAMAPKILSEGGQEIYGYSVVDRTWAIQQGMAGYSKDLAAAQAHDRVGARPLTVKAVSAMGANRTDVVISNSDAQLLIGSGPSLAFLEQARVVLVVD